MIAALLLGRKGSVGFPGKNLFPVMGYAQPVLFGLQRQDVSNLIQLSIRKFG